MRSSVASRRLGASLHKPIAGDRSAATASSRKRLIPRSCGGILRARGLGTFPAVLRGISRLAYLNGDQYVGHFPAMVAPVVGPDGKLRSVHRTYVGDVPTRKKLLSSVGGGAAIRLFEPTDALGIAEGIETAIAAHELFGLPTWATISTAIMETFEPPQGVKHLVIFGDNDSNFAGQKAAYTLAHRLSRDTDLIINVRIPAQPGTDWLDVLCTTRRAA
jgi:putative DNA primase/helicase